MHHTVLLSGLKKNRFKKTPFFLFYSEKTVFLGLLKRNKFFFFFQEKHKNPIHAISPFSKFHKKNLLYPLWH